ncbi:hypothetical protein SASPL_148142 [Salvia splendens]|uniref:Chaperone DnaJ C-terminal domain-containing protein n=1 Tax=Salvia splendens TaxID=180675 RepID=A0A8X8W9J1_SALSN|nr:hypothetical protein SASPL_148142 [Salvia splendens]
MGEHSKPNPSDLIQNKSNILIIALISRSKTKKHNGGREGDDKRHDKGKFKQGIDHDGKQATTLPQLGNGSDLPRLSRNLSYHSRISQPTGRTAKGHLSRAFSDILTTRGARACACAHTLSRNVSKGVPAPIIFSNSSGLLKPAAMEKRLECTLEELCFGCIKKDAITRDAYKGNGQSVKEDETVTIKVEPGWRRGTKITFEGKGCPGAADVVFVVAEKEHSLFKRRDDDLQMEVEIMLGDALSGCTLLLPLLGARRPAS